MSFYKRVSFILVCGVLAVLVASWVAPRIITVLFTPPVSFGTNCEPAAAWSMKRLVVSQSVAFILGILVALVGSFYLKNRKIDSDPKPLPQS